MKTFGGQFKIKKKIKHKEKDKNCMCENCIKVRNFIEKSKKVEEEKEKTVKDRIDELNEKANPEKIRTDNADRPIEKKLEHENDGLKRLPTGAIIQENKRSNMSTDDVIRQNTGEK